MPYYDEEYKEVRFDIYCSRCVREKEPESDDKCHECLSNPLNLYSEKPVNWKGIEGFEDYIASEEEEKK